MIHPIQLTSVLYVVQRMTSLSAFFLLLALILHVSARRRKELDRVAVSWLILAWCVFWPLSILSKETGILLPGFVAVYELIVRRSERAAPGLAGANDAFSLDRAGPGACPLSCIAVRAMDFFRLRDPLLFPGGAPVDRTASALGIYSLDCVSQLWNRSPCFMTI